MKAKFIKILLPYHIYDVSTTEILLDLQTQF